MPWLVLVGFLGWPVMGYLGWRYALRDRVAHAVADAATPPGGTDRFLLVARTPSGARARQMFERATVGQGEVVELWDHGTCRGRKGPALTGG